MIICTPYDRQMNILFARHGFSKYIFHLNPHKPALKLKKLVSTSFSQYQPTPLPPLPTVRPHIPPYFTFFWHVDKYSSQITDVPPAKTVSNQTMSLGSKCEWLSQEDLKIFVRHSTQQWTWPWRWTWLTGAWPATNTPQWAVFSISHCPPISDSSLASSVTRATAHTNAGTVMK